MQITAYDQISVFQHLQPEWNELLQRSTSNRIFSTWEWQSAWWEAYHPGNLWVITCRDNTGRLVGIAPWFIETHPTRGQVARSIGCVEVTDYLDIILDNGCVDDVLNTLAAYLADNHSKFDLIDICNLPEGFPGHDRFPGHLTHHNFQVEITQQEVCPVIELPSDWESYFELLDKKQRHELRRKLRRAEGAPEKVDWYVVDSRHNLERESERFLELMAASQLEKATFLQDPRNVDFFKKIVPLAYQNKWLQLSFLTIGDQAAAAYFNFVYNGHVLVYNSGLLPDRYGHLSPGIVLLAHNIRLAIESGYKVFDFLRGSEIYKYRMGGKDTRVYMLKARLPAQ